MEHGVCGETGERSETGIRRQLAEIRGQKSEVRDQSVGLRNGVGRRSGNSCYFLRKNLLAVFILLAVSFISLASLTPGISSTFS
jgi:hypothetical protein